jgi:CubicO group peptidase (beta-lactamase class C family)
VAIKPTEPSTPSTLYYGASTTKAQLCALWAIYIRSDANQTKGDGKVTLATPVAKIIPNDFILADEYTTNHVTIEDCLSHRTGYPGHQYSLGDDGTRTPKDVTRNLRNLPAQKELRADFQYCNLIYIAASYALETLTGKSISRIFRDTLWNPLGMRNTHASYDDAAVALKEKGGTLAKGYTWTKLPGDPEENAGELREEHYIRFLEFSGAGCVISTADDYTKWMRCMLNGSHPLSEDMIEDLFKPRAVVIDSIPGEGPLDSTINYCLEWFTGSYRGTQIFWNPGLLVGGGNLVLLAPSLKWGVSFFSNGANSEAKMKSLSYWLLD